MAPPAASAAREASTAPTPCGELGCALYDTPEAAFAAVLREAPLVLAVGEAHAQKDTTVASSTRRFTELFLPLLKGRASDLLVELMLPPAGCKKQEDAVRTEQKQVTQQQAATNQNEYVTLGDTARKLGVIPDALRPSCSDLDLIASAGDESIFEMLAAVERLTAAQTKALLAKSASRSDARMVVTYGGAMHNDVAPREGRARFSYASDLTAATSGRYVELDLFVPEFVSDTETWRSFEWYAHYDRQTMGAKTALFRPRSGSYVLLFPVTAR